MYIYITESLCYTAETNTTVKKKKKQVYGLPWWSSG